MRGDWQLSMVLDSDGRMVRWPKKRVQQAAVIAYMATKFEAEREYSEREVNEILEHWHTFRDWALLRRSLWDHALMDREADGSRYRLSVQAEPVG